MAKKRTKQTSDRVASIAARLMDAHRRGLLLCQRWSRDGKKLSSCTNQVASVLASCLSQDTTKGKRFTERVKSAGKVDVTVLASSNPGKRKAKRAKKARRK